VNHGFSRHPWRFGIGKSGTQSQRWVVLGCRPGSTYVGHISARAAEIKEISVRSRQMLFSTGRESSLCASFGVWQFGGRGFRGEMTRLTMTFKFQALALLLLAGLTQVIPEACAEVRQPQESEKNYLFYMHGAWVEMHGLEKTHPIHGAYKYYEIVHVLQAKGYEVISEIRTGEVPFGGYADKVAGQVLALIGKGVPPEHITVLGHSKGGLMTLIVASRVNEPNVNYVVMAGCGRMGTAFRRPYQIFLDRDARRLKGRILSMVDADDREAGSCQEAFGRASDAQTRETVLHTGRGHGLFYSPQPAWIEKVVEWIQ